VTELHQYAGTTCTCGARFLTALDRCPECGAWDLAPSLIDARGVVVARTSTTATDGESRSFGLVELDGGLRTIGLTDGDLVMGSHVHAAVGAAGHPVYVADDEPGAP
jgi:uncharacterized OB-fold protein